MDILENMDTIISLICGLGSVIMFLGAKKQKDECIKISNRIDQNIQILNKNSSIESNDVYNIDSVKTFDNRKGIKQQ